MILHLLDIKILKEFIYRCECRECSRRMCSEYKAKNREKVKNYNKTYKEQHRDETSAFNKKYYQEHKESERIRTRETHRRLRETSISFKLASSMRGRIKKVITSGSKSKKTMEILGCDIEFFIKWIEYQFDENMSFDNYGSYWALDHVIPCASFDMILPADQDKCFHWSNYQPLEARENIVKGAKIHNEMIDKHKAKVIKFIDNFDKTLNLKYTLL